MADKPKRITDIGAPHYSKFLPPVMTKNYGKWKYHEVINKGAMKHVSETGDELYTVRMASPRLVSTDFIREVCDIAEKYLRRISAFHHAEQRRVLSRQSTARASPGRAQETRPSGRRHRLRHQQRGAHPGLGPLPHAGHRRLGCREGRDGRAARVFHHEDASGESKGRACLLPEYVRSGALLRHLHPRHSPQAAEGQRGDNRESVRDPHDHCLLSDRRNRPEPCC